MPLISGYNGKKKKAGSYGKNDRMLSKVTGAFRKRKK